MLQDLSIRNVAIIEDISVSFTDHMTVLTGETGAGKSIILDALALLLGARANQDIIRHGTEKASIEGLFQVADDSPIWTILYSHGLEVTDELIIRRDILAGGKSSARINGQLVTVSLVKELAPYLVDIHGQHDQELLMSQTAHMILLDQFGDGTFQAIKAAYQKTFEAYRDLRRRIITKKEAQSTNQARAELLAFQLSEIEAIGIEAGEDRRLEDERQLLQQNQETFDSLTLVHGLLDDPDTSSIDAIRRAFGELEDLAQKDSDYQFISDQLSESYYLLEEVARQIGQKRESLSPNDDRLAQIERRLDSLHILSVKYGGTSDNVLAYYQEISQEYEALTGGRESLDELEKELAALQVSLIAQADTLSQLRHRLAEDLEQAIHQELADLYMPHARFQVVFEEGKFTKDGREKIYFAIESNPGEGVKQLVKVASGGELSRLMLAIKTALSRKEPQKTFVFDEVDIGVSGRVAQAIAQKIHMISETSQVLVISHIPQTIAIADTQMHITKEVTGEKTHSYIRMLTDAERVDEIAGMLAGDRITKEARDQANILLENGHKSLSQ